MFSVETKALEAKTSGSRTGKAAAWAVSAFGTESPTNAKIHDSE